MLYSGLFISLTISGIMSLNMIKMYFWDSSIILQKFNTCRQTHKTVNWNFSFCRLKNESKDIFVILHNLAFYKQIEKNCKLHADCFTPILHMFAVFRGELFHLDSIIVWYVYITSKSYDDFCGLLHDIQCTLCIVVMQMYYRYCIHVGFVMHKSL